MTNQEQTQASIDLSNMPRHVAIIMDGNNRWAQQRGISGAKGHAAGVDALREIVRTCADYDNIDILTVFAFSSENWSRPSQEVEALMELLLTALIEEIPELNKNDVRMEIIGERNRFSEQLQQQMADAEALTASNKKMLLAIALNYGGQWDIVNAAQQLAIKVAQEEIRPEDISAQVFQQQLCLGQYPMPDLCIRTGNEQRISNFLLWQLAYAELYFSDLYWPDFGRDAFHQALIWYQDRQRRFGGRCDVTKENACKSSEKNIEQGCSSA